MVPGVAMAAAAAAGTLHAARHGRVNERQRTNMRGLRNAFKVAAVRASRICGGEALARGSRSGD